MRSDRVAISLNLILLMLVAFLPVTTAVLGTWILSERDRPVAVLLYGSLFVVFGLVHNLLWWYGAYRAGLTREDLAAHERRTLTLSWASGPVLYGLCLALAFVDSRYAIAGFAVIALLFLLPTPQLLALARRTRRKRAAVPRRRRKP